MSSPERTSQPMISVAHTSPVVASAAGLSAVYLPALCAEVPAVVEHKMRLLLDPRDAPMVSIIPPPAALSLEMDEDDRMILALDPSLVAHRGIRYAAQVSSDPYLYGIMNSLRCGFRYGLVPPERYLDDVAPAIAEHLGRFYPVRMRKRESHGLSPARLAIVLAIVEERLHEGIPVAEMAAAVHLSPYHFARMFRRSSGMSPHAYLTKRRLERARELLASTSLSMQEIARRVGYRNQAHFTRVFHVGTGSVPRRYRMQNRARPSEAASR